MLLPTGELLSSIQIAPLTIRIYKKSCLQCDECAKQSLLLTTFPSLNGEQILGKFGSR